MKINIQVVDSKNNTSRLYEWNIHEDMFVHDVLDGVSLKCDTPNEFFNYSNGEVVDNNITFRRAGILDGDTLILNCNGNKFTQNMATPLKSNMTFDSYNENNNDGMFADIGAKIKTVVQVFFWLMVIASVIVGIMICSTMNAALGVIVIIVVPLLSWISSLVFYAIGDIADNLEKCRELLEKK